MKYIIKSSALVLFLFLISHIIPKKFFFRPWEYMSTGNKAMPFKPNYSVNMSSRGDLFRDKNDTVLISWQTDYLGFRNSQISDSIEILIVGDSYSVGSGLDQSKIITSILNSKGFSSYSISPYNPICGVKLFKKEFGYIPRTVIWQTTERTLNRTYGSECNKELNSSYWKKFQTFFYGDKTIGLIKNYLFDSSFKADKILTSNGVVYFLPANVPDSYYYNSIPIVLENLRKIDEILPEDVNLHFMPIPDKMTVINPLSYKEFTKFIDNIELKFLCYRIFDKNINVEDLNNFYQFDDSHFNSNGIEIMANKIICSN